MNEYSNTSAKTYQQTDGKKYLVIPAIERAIPNSTKNNQKLLDVACGNGDFFTLANTKGYKYYGLDVSPDMISRAKTEYPKGIYTVAPSTEFSNEILTKFEIILICMLFPCFNKKEDIIDTLKECKKVLNKDGKIIIVVTHPLFDGYMRKKLFNLDFVETTFKGYFVSPVPMKIHKKFDNGNFTFNDYHWTLTDYVESINKAGLFINTIDECPPTQAPKNFVYEKSNYPTYLLLNCK